MKEIVKTLSDAIIASGKPIGSLKDAIFNYFNTNGIPKSDWGVIWEQLVELHSSKPVTNSLAERITGVKTDTTPVNYSQSTSDLKKREPRKTVFGDIKKIAG